MGMRGTDGWEQQAAPSGYVHAPVEDTRHREQLARWFAGRCLRCLRGTSCNTRCEADGGRHLVT